jgi:hypothetical protein
VTRRIRYEIEPMTLGNMRELGVRSLDVSCWNCQHRAVLSADRWPDNGAHLRPSDGVHELRNRRGRRSAELAGAAAAGDADRGTMASHLEWQALDVLARHPDGCAEGDWESEPSDPTLN